MIENKKRRKIISKVPIYGELKTINQKNVKKASWKAQAISLNESSQLIKTYP